MPDVSRSAFNAGAVAALTGPRLLKDARLAAWERFAAAQLPSESDEIWRYSRIDELDLARYQPQPPGREPTLPQLPRRVKELVQSLGSEATVVVTHNGGEAEVVRPQAGLELRALAEGGLATGAADGYGGPARDVWTDFNCAFVRAPWSARVAAGAVLDQPVVLVHWVDGEGGAFFPHLEVELEEGASAELLEVIASPDVDALVVPLTTLVIGPGAHARFAQVQLLGKRVWQLGNIASRVGRDGFLNCMTVALGGDYARVRTDSVLEGPGGQSELLAGYFGTGSQVHDLRTVQLHAAPQARSELLFKGAVANDARSVYSGLIRVEKGARGTNAFQTNRNLVLSEGAHADSVPNLEIEDNDVRCSHASAVGPIDESQLFYLESRGVPTAAAERLIVLGFMRDVLERSPVRGMLEWLQEAVADKLVAAGLGGGRPEVSRALRR
ncbi:MAG: Fe-S cluster assembly protein SufD [Acidimicrobiales bacterium]